MIQQYCNKVEDPGSKKRPIRKDQDAETYRLVDDIDRRVNSDPEKDKEFVNERRYFNSFEDVRIAREWADGWAHFLNNVCQRDFKLRDHDTCPKNVTHVGYTIDPDQRAKDHYKHASSSVLQYLVDATALVLSDQLTKEGQRLGEFKMRYHSLRLIHDEDLADASEHLDSMEAGSYVIFGGTNTTYGGNSNVSAHQGDVQQLYDKNQAELWNKTHFREGLMRIDAAYDTELERIKLTEETADLFKKCKESWDLLEGAKSAGKDDLKQVNDLRIQFRDNIEEWAEPWCGLFEDATKLRQINGHFGTFIKAVAALNIYPEKANTGMIAALDEGEGEDVEMTGQ